MMTHTKTQKYTAASAVNPRSLALALTLLFIGGFLVSSLQAGATHTRFDSKYRSFTQLFTKAETKTPPKPTGLEHLLGRWSGASVPWQNHASALRIPSVSPPLSIDSTGNDQTNGENNGENSDENNGEIVTENRPDNPREVIIIDREESHDQSEEQLLENVYGHGGFEEALTLEDLENRANR